MKAYVITIISVLLMIALCSCGMPISPNDANETMNPVSTTIVSDTDCSAEAQTYAPVEFGEKYLGEFKDLAIGNEIVVNNGGVEHLTIGSPDKIYRLDKGDTYLDIKIATASESDEYNIANYSVKVEVLEPDILSAEIIDESRIVGIGFGMGGLSVTGLSAGVAHLYVTITYEPTGGSVTQQIIIIVRDPTETTP